MRGHEREAVRLAEQQREVGRPLRLGRLGVPVAMYVCGYVDVDVMAVSDLVAACTCASVGPSIVGAREREFFNGAPNAPKVHWVKSVMWLPPRPIHTHPPPQPQDPPDVAAPSREPAARDEVVQARVQREPELRGRRP